jgi:hypothetical protein
MLGSSGEKPLSKAKSEPSRNPSFLKRIWRFRGPRKKKKHSPVGRRPLHLPAQSALSSAFMVKNEFQKKLRFGLG